MKKKWSASLRIWHWFNALVVVSLMVTGLLLKLGGDIVDTFGKPHVLTGFVLCFLILFRVVRALCFGDRRVFQEAARLRKEAIRHLLEKGLPRSREAFHLFHKAGVKGSYLGVYALLIAMAVTGAGMALLTQMEGNPDTVHLLGEIHEVVFILLAIFVPLHIGGVVVAELTDEPNIVSDMIHGGKEE
jgi:Ni/Fe-hydrogenase 1 B-type cytochrome subunit